MAEAKFYTYIHRKADTGEVFYVGKGSTVRIDATKDRSEYWHRVVKKHGIIKEITERFHIEEDAFINEKRLIAEFRAAGAVLVNFSIGGEGPSGAKRSEETRKKMSIARRKVVLPPVTEETKAKMSASAKGRPMSAEAIEKTIAFHTGRKRPAETIAKMSASLKGKGVGRKHSAESIEKMRIAQKGKSIGRKASEETKAKQRAARAKQPPMTEEKKIKLLAGQAAYWTARRAAKENANQISMFE